MCGLTSNAGGIETVALKINRELDPTKFHFHYLATDGGVAYENEFRKLGATIHRVALVHHAPIDRVIKLNAFFKENSGKFDIVHCSECALYSILCVVLARKYGAKKVIIHSRQSEHIVHSCWNIVRHSINKHLINCFATDFVACSEVAARFMFSKRIIKQKKYRIIYNPANISEYSYDESKRNLIRNQMNMENNIIVGHVGVFLPFKNHRFIIEIFQRIVEKEQNARLMLIGGGEKEAISEIKRYAQNLKILDKIVFLGKVNNVHECLSAMDVFLFPSISEGFPNVVIEAQVAGLGCVLSDKITKEVSIINDKVKFIPLDLDPDIWADKVLFYARNPNRTVEISAFDRLQILNVVQEYSELYSIADERK